MPFKIYIARILYKRSFKAEENCPAVGLEMPEIAGLKELLDVEGAPEILSHYARFARAHGGCLSGAQVSDWSAVEKHTPYGFLAHLAGLGFTNIRDAAEILFKFHKLLAEAGICNWQFDEDEEDEWDFAVGELLNFYEEKFLFIDAETEDEAWAKAAKIGEEGELEYTNAYGDMVVWSFVGIVDVQETTVKDGVEFFSHYIRGRGVDVVDVEV